MPLVQEHPRKHRVSLPQRHETHIGANMSDPKDWPGRTHYDDCWQDHLGCARDLIEQYSIELAQWRNGSARVNGKLLAEIDRLRAALKQIASGDLIQGMSHELFASKTLDATDQPDPLASKDHDLARQASGWDANGAPVED
jgi:hypothetical protein